MVEDWLTKPEILTTKMQSSKKLTQSFEHIYRAKMRTFTSADIVEDENENTLRYPMKILNTLSHG